MGNALPDLLLRDYDDLIGLHVEKVFKFTKPILAGKTRFVRFTHDNSFHAIKSHSKYPYPTIFLCRFPLANSSETCGSKILPCYSTIY